LQQHDERLIFVIRPNCAPDLPPAGRQGEDLAGRGGVVFRQLDVGVPLEIGRNGEPVLPDGVGYTSTRHLPRDRARAPQALRVDARDAPVRERTQPLRRRPRSTAVPEQSDARRSKGAAHATNLFYKATQFRWLRGEDKVDTYKLPEAKRSTSSFCRRCGSIMPRVSRENDIAVVAGGSLDTDPPMRSLRHIYTNYKAPWFEITDSAPQFPEGPPGR
jgi:hypothetical protein